MWLVSEVLQAWVTWASKQGPVEDMLLVGEITDEFCWGGLSS